MLNCKDTKFESNSQRTATVGHGSSNCKDTKFESNSQMRYHVNLD